MMPPPPVLASPTPLPSGSHSPSSSWSASISSLQLCTSLASFLFFLCFSLVGHFFLGKSPPFPAEIKVSTFRLSRCHSLVPSFLQAEHSRSIATGRILVLDYWLGRAACVTPVVAGAAAAAEVLALSIGDSSTGYERLAINDFTLSLFRCVGKGVNSTGKARRG